MDNLEELLEEVAEKRAALRKAEDLSALARIIAEQMPEWQEYEMRREIVNDLRDDVGAAEAATRIAILAEYEHTGSKAPLKGAGVRVLRKASYVLAEALAWCKDNAPALLTVDEKKFVKADLEGAPITWIETPTATVSGDLSEYEAAE